MRSRVEILSHNKGPRLNYTLIPWAPGRFRASPPWGRMPLGPESSIFRRNRPIRISDGSAGSNYLDPPRMPPLFVIPVFPWFCNRSCYANCYNCYLSGPYFFTVFPTNGPVIHVARGAALYCDTGHLFLGDAMVRLRGCIPYGGFFWRSRVLRPAIRSVPPAGHRIYVSGVRSRSMCG